MEVKNGYIEYAIKVFSLTDKSALPVCVLTKL